MTIPILVFEFNNLIRITRQQYILTIYNKEIFVKFSSINYELKSINYGLKPDKTVNLVYGCPLIKLVHLGAL